MEKLIDSFVAAVEALGFERAILVIVIGAAVFHFLTQPRATKGAVPASGPSQKHVGACGFNPSAQELMVRRVLDDLHHDVREVRDVVHKIDQRIT